MINFLNRFIKPRKIVFTGCMDGNGLIGTDEGLPWHIPSELRHFKRLTIGETIVIGRRTFEMIGVLPKRKTIVLSRDASFNPEGVVVEHSVEDILKNHKEDLYICGGNMIYEAFFEYYTHAVFTELISTFKGTVYLSPKIRNLLLDSPTTYKIINYGKRKNSVYNWIDIERDNCNSDLYEKVKQSTDVFSKDFVIAISVVKIK